MFSIDPLSKTPIYEQIINQLEKLIMLGAIAPGEPIPSVRSLSMELKANPNTIQKAYSDLDNRGIIRSVPGKGCFVSAQARQIIMDNARGHMAELTAICEKLKLAGIDEQSMINAVKSVFAPNNNKEANNDKR